MTALFRVAPHPLGVVVYPRPGKMGELLLPGEGCCGISFEQLMRAANTTGQVEVETCGDPAHLRC